MQDDKGVAWKASLLSLRSQDHALDRDGVAETSSNERNDSCVRGRDRERNIICLDDG